MADPIRDRARQWRYLGLVLIAVALAAVYLWWVLRNIAVTGSGGISSVSFGISEAVVEMLLAVFVLLGMLGLRALRIRQSAARSRRG